MSQKEHWEKGLLGQPHAPSPRQKAWRRRLLDVKAMIPGPLQKAARSIWPRRTLRLWLVLPLLLTLVFLVSRVGHSSHEADAPKLEQLVERVGKVPLEEQFDDSQIEEPEEVPPLHVDAHGREIPDYRELFSLSTRDRKYFLIWFDGEASYNANLIPHPTESEKWIVMAQHEQFSLAYWEPEQLICVATFFFGVLVCEGHPGILPAQKSIMGNCTGELDYSNMRKGPRDGRMFYGPGEPYIMYGSQSSVTCFGLWLQDARMLLEPFRLDRTRVGFYRDATELHRPPPWSAMEKNFFLFWDSRGAAYVHYDVWPKRVFAQLDYNGAAFPDLAPASAGNDSRCMASFMPEVKSQFESMHQATNSLSITLCKREDARCVPTDANTFIMAIIHHKTFYEFHAVYEPYLIMFQRTAPFALHAISQRPFWIHGRTNLTAASDSSHYRMNPQDIPAGHSEMFYITSISWQSHGQKYHGYIDDPLFLVFGVEDARSGAIDVTAGDLLQDLAFCELAMSD